MRRFGELPSDLDDQDLTLGPPPAWFRPESAFYSQGGYYGPGFEIVGSSPYYGGLGDREQEIEANPVEELEALKYKQALNKKIPSQAYRYTSINPISPMFRNRKAKYGFGEVSSKKGVLTLLIAGIAIMLSLPI